MTQPIKSTFPQLTELSIFKDFVIEKPKTIFEIIRDNLMWFDLCAPEGLGSSDFVKGQLASFKKVVSLFSIPDTFKESLNLKDKIYSVYDSFSRNEPLKLVADSVEKAVVSFFGLVEAGSRMVVMCDLWSICKIEKVALVGAIGSFADIVVVTDGIGRTAFDLWTLYQAPAKENEIERTIDSVKTQHKWGILALNISVFAIEVLSLVALALAVAPVFFLALSSAILIADVAIFVTGKQLDRQERYLREHKLYQAGYDAGLGKKSLTPALV